VTAFPTELNAIENRVRAIDPIKYSNTRNFQGGAVTRLGPYISRSVISTKLVLEHVKTLNLEWKQVEKMVQELAWRDYWQLVWIEKRDEIFQDLKHQQKPISNHQIPEAIMNANTGIKAIDEAIEELYEMGYMHNHMRMYVASVCCNIAHSHWLEPAKWMYSHLLDGDIASNHLSWQWVAGAFANKKYVANQENINKYFNSQQRKTFLDVDYSEFEHLETPEHFNNTKPLGAKLSLPKNEKVNIESSKKTLIYNYYNIDPYWHQRADVQRIYLMEPSFYQKYPVSQKCINFALELTQNIEGIKVFVGEFSALNKILNSKLIHFKEHPSNDHYQGHQESRTWMTSVKGYYPSFFAYWKKAKKELLY